MSNEAVSDDMLFEILSDGGSYEKFLDVIFSFLYRRTCFFKSVKDGDSEDLGLSHGLAEKMVNVICKKYQQLEAQKQNNIVPEPVYVQECREEIVETTEMESEYTASATCKAAASFDSDVSKHAETQKAEPVPLEATDRNGIVVEQTYYESNPECYNGASYDTYCWAQTISDLDVQIKVPVCVKCGKQVKVHISHTHLKAEILKTNDEWEVLLDGQLYSKINTEGSTWTLDPGRHIHIHLEKPKQRFWEALLEGEPKINIRTIDCSKPYEDLGEEEQAKIQELLYDQHQKRLGKPTIKEKKVHEILKEAWNKEDSPFKGQKFDPSYFNVMG